MELAEHRLRKKMRRNFDWNKELVISPQSIIFQIFNTITILLSFSSSLVYGYFACFRKDIEHDHYEQNGSFNKVEATFEILFFLEMITMFFKEYQPKGSMYPVRDIKSIAKIYISTQFVYDLIPLVPFRFVI